MTSFLHFLNLMGGLFTNHQRRKLMLSSWIFYLVAFAMLGCFKITNTVPEAIGCIKQTTSVIMEVADEL